MKRARKQSKPRAWRVSILRARLVHLGRVYAVDRETAEAKAIEEFKLRDIDRPRLLVEELL